MLAYVGKQKKINFSSHQKHTFLLPLSFIGRAEEGGGSLRVGLSMATLVKSGTQWHASVPKTSNQAFLNMPNNF